MTIVSLQVCFSRFVHELYPRQPAQGRWLHGQYCMQACPVGTTRRSARRTVELNYHPLGAGGCGRIVAGLS